MKVSSLFSGAGALDLGLEKVCCKAMGLCLHTETGVCRAAMCGHGKWLLKGDTRGYNIVLVLLQVYVDYYASNGGSMGSADKRDDVCSDVQEVVQRP